MQAAVAYGTLILTGIVLALLLPFALHRTYLLILSRRKREDVRGRLSVVLGACLQYLRQSVKNANIEEIIEEWRRNGNEIQRSAAGQISAGAGRCP